MENSQQKGRGCPINKLVVNFLVTSAFFQLSAAISGLREAVEGDQVTRKIITEGRRIAKTLHGNNQGVMTHLCDDAEHVCDKMATFSRQGLVRNYLKLSH